MSRQVRRVLTAAITVASLSLVFVIGFVWAMNVWSAALITLAWFTIRRPGERFRDFVPRMCWPEDFYNAMRDGRTP